MKPFILIYDLLKNGKTHHILDFDISYCVLNIKLFENCIYYNNKNITDTFVDSIVFFSANEDGLGYIKQINLNMQQLTQKLVDIRDVIVEKCYKIYNDPRFFEILGNKELTYQCLINTVPCPKFGNIDIYPCIVAKNNASGGRQRYLCNTNNEVNSAISKIKTNYCVTEYIDSFNLNLNCFCNLRLLVLDNILLEWYYRPSGNWNIHTKTQTLSKIIPADNFFADWKLHNQHILDLFIQNIFDVLGLGMFAIDCILHIESNTIFLCEVGYKCMDENFFQGCTEIKNFIKPSHDINTFKKTLISHIMI